MQDCTYVVITTVELLHINVKGDWKRAWRREDSQCVRVDTVHCHGQWLSFL